VSFQMEKRQWKKNWWEGVTWQTSYLKHLVMINWTLIFNMRIGQSQCYHLLKILFARSCAHSPTLFCFWTPINSHRLSHHQPIALRSSLCFKPARVAKFSTLIIEEGATKESKNFMIHSYWANKHFLVQYILYFNLLKLQNLKWNSLQSNTNQFL